MEHPNSYLVLQIYKYLAIIPIYDDERMRGLFVPIVALIDVYVLFNCIGALLYLIRYLFIFME